jgi:hypothetical protein
MAACHCTVTDLTRRALRATVCEECESAPLTCDYRSADVAKPCEATCDLFQRLSGTEAQLQVLWDRGELRFEQVACERCRTRWLDARGAADAMPADCPIGQFLKASVNVNRPGQPGGRLLG